MLENAKSLNLYKVWKFKEIFRNIFVLVNENYGYVSMQSMAFGDLLSFWLFRFVFLQKFCQIGILFD